MVHKPSQNTRVLGDISFQSSLIAAMHPSTAYDVKKWLFVPNAYTEYRYILGTRGTKPLICVGVNPSTAAPDHLDPTLQSVQRIALHNGFDPSSCSMYMPNGRHPRRTWILSVIRSCITRICRRSDMPSHFLQSPLYGPPGGLL